MILRFLRFFGFGPRQAEREGRTAGPPLVPPALEKPKPLHRDQFDPPAPLKRHPLLEKMTSPEVMQRLYGDLMPGGKLDVIHRDFGPAFEHVDVSWHLEGKPVAQLTSKLFASKDGSIDLYGSNAFVDPAYRGLGLSARALPRQLEWLRRHSDHPNTRMTIGAGAVHGEKVGPYVWANSGFDFANIYGERAELHVNTTARTAYGHQPEPEVFRKAFDQWLTAKAKEGQLPDDPGLLDGLRAASQHWQHSWDIANFHVPGLEVEAAVGEKVGKYSLGKAFLLDPQTPTWAGVFFVNEPHSTAAQIQNAYFKLAVERAAAKAAEAAKPREPEASPEEKVQAPSKGKKKSGAKRRPQV